MQTVHSTNDSTGVALGRDELAALADAAVWAPSAENRHLFALRSGRDGLVLQGSDAFVAAPLHRKVLALLSFGAVAENIVVRGARLGYRVDVLDQNEVADRTFTARLRFARVDRLDSALDAAIATRRTNRALRFRGPPLAPAELDAMARLAHDLDGVTIEFVQSRRRRAQLLRLVRIAESERFNTRALHEELFSAIRFDVGWRDTVPEGLPPGALAVEPPLRPAFAQLRRWPVMNGLRWSGGHRLLGRRAAWLPCLLSPHVGVIYTRYGLERGAFSAGRALQRLWLEAERRGLAFQPLAASPLLALPAYTDVPAATGERLRRGWQQLSDATPAIVFRMGHAPRPGVRAGRTAPLPIEPLA